MKVTFTFAGSKSMTSVTFTPASVKSKAFAPLHRHEKRLKSCMYYEKIFNRCIRIYANVSVKNVFIRVWAFVYMYCWKQVSYLNITALTHSDSFRLATLFPSNISIIGDQNGD